MRLRYLSLLSLTLFMSFMIFQVLQPIQAAGTVGTGTPESCTESALDAALAGGGTITFNCGAGQAVLTLGTEKVIAQNTVIDGGGLVTISGRHATRVFKVNAGVTFEVRKLIIAHGAANDTSETARDGNGAGIFNDGGAVTLIDSTVKARNNPGKRMIQKASCTYVRPSAMMLPQLGMWGGVPAPRNDRYASTRIADAQM